MSSIYFAVVAVLRIVFFMLHTVNYFLLTYYRWGWGASFLGVPLAGRAFGTNTALGPHTSNMRCKCASIPHASPPAPAVGCGSSIDYSK